MRETNTAETRKKRILLIENNESLIESMFVLFGHELDVVVAQHMDEARELFNNGGFDLIFLELIVPKNKESVRKLKELDAKRHAILMRLSEITRSDSREDYFGGEAQQLREQIDRLNDEEITPLLSLEGGCEILEEFARKVGGRLNVPVVVYTCRSEAGLKERCQKVICPDRFLWFFKPHISPLEIKRSILEFISNKAT